MSIHDNSTRVSVNGRLEDPNEWSEEVAAALAARDGLMLTPAHCGNLPVTVNILA